MVEDLSKLKVVELKERLLAAGLQTSGKKDELIQRLLEYQKSQQEVVTEEEVVNNDVAETDTNTKNTIEDEKDEKEKKANISAKSVTESTTSVIPSTIGSTTVKSPLSENNISPKQAEMIAELEKRKKRSERFGIPLKDEDIALERAVKFGTSSNDQTSSTKNGEKSLNKNVGKRKLTEEAQNILNKRAERFGKPTNVVGKKDVPPDIQEKLNKRAERFGMNKA